MNRRVLAGLIILISGFVALALFYYVYSVRNSVISYDFSNGILGWRVTHTSNIPDDWSVNGDYDAENDIYFVNLERRDSFEDGGGVGILRNVDIDVSKMEGLYIKTDVRVWDHSLEGSGFFDDSILGGVGEYPLTIWITYTNLIGEKDNRFVWGFLTKKNINLKTNYDLVEEGKWHSFVSGDIKELLPDIAVINVIALKGRGWDFHSNIGGKFEILDTRPSTEELRFEPSISAEEISSDSSPIDLLSLFRVGDAELSVRLAESPRDREMGLSRIDILPETQGLLFVYDSSGPHSIWMKNMKFTIDVIWFDDEFRVVDMMGNLSPESYPEVFTPSSPARYILEVSAGFIGDNGISIGDKGALTI